MRMRRNAAWVAVLTAIVGSLFVGIVEGRTVLTPFDFTGHWIGCAVGQVLLEGDFTAMGLRKSKVRLQGQLDVGSETISGPATIANKGCSNSKTETAQVVITKATSPPSLCPTPTTTSSTTSTSTSLP